MSWGAILVLDYLPDILCRREINYIMYVPCYFDFYLPRITLILKQIPKPTTSNYKVGWSTQQNLKYLALVLSGTKQERYRHCRLEIWPKKKSELLLLMSWKAVLIPTEKYWKNLICHLPWILLISTK